MKKTLVTSYMLSDYIELWIKKKVGAVRVLTKRKKEKKGGVKVRGGLEGVREGGARRLVAC